MQKSAALSATDEEGGPCCGVLMRSALKRLCRPTVTHRTFLSDRASDSKDRRSAEKALHRTFAIILVSGEAQREGGLLTGRVAGVEGRRQRNPTSRTAR